MTREEIEELKGLAASMGLYDDKNPCKRAVILGKAIQALEQEPRIGHWIEHDRKALREQGYYRCSECNHGYQRYERGIRKSEVPYINGQKYELHRIDKFCPNCGARMKSEE